MTEVGTLPVREQVARALREGGRARATITSRSSGKHLTIRVACKRRGPDGRFISRARTDGRVGIELADAVFVDGGDYAFGGWVGTLYLDSGEWRSPKQWDDPRGPHYLWAAQALIQWALTGSERFAEQAEVALAEECSVCGKTLTDPVSIERGVGPECLGKITGSQHV